MTLQVMLCAQDGMMLCGFGRFLRVFHTDDYDELVLLLTQMVEKLRVMGMGRKRKDDVSVFLLPGKLTFVCPIL